jgi:hypothetical protein
LNFLLPLLEFSNFSSRTRLQSSRNKEGNSANHVIVGGRHSNHPRLFLKKRRYSTAYNSSNNKVKLDPWFLTGFIDAEGTFIVPLRPKNDFKCGWEVLSEFKLGLHLKDLPLLEAIKAYLGDIGTISVNKAKNVAVFRIASLKDLAVIIDHLTRYPLITQKRADFELFKRVVGIKLSGRHTTLDGLQEIVNIRASLNRGLTERLLLAFPQTIPVIRPMVGKADPKTLHPSWVAGFVSGEGNFLIGISKSPASKNGYHCYLRFKISQDCRDEFLLRSFIAFFGCGSWARFDNIVEFICVNTKDINNIILPFFIKYPILGVKALDFNDWCLGAEILKNKAHLTPEGLAQLKAFKSGMNKNRMV